MDTRTDPGQYYPGGRIMVRPDVAPDQGRVIRWGDIQDKPDFSDVAALGAADSVGNVKTIVNKIVDKMKTAVIVLLCGLCGALSAFAATTLNDMPGTNEVYTAAETDAAINGIPRITESEVYEGWAAKAEDSLHADYASDAANAEYAAEAESANFANEASHAYEAVEAEIAARAEDASQAYALKDDARGDVRQGYEIFAQIDAAMETNATQSAQLSAMPATVTNIVRDLSQGGEYSWMRPGDWYVKAVTDVEVIDGVVVHGERVDDIGRVYSNTVYTTVYGMSAQCTAEPLDASSMAVPVVAHWDALTAGADIDQAGRIVATNSGIYRVSATATNGAVRYAEIAISAERSEVHSNVLTYVADTAPARAATQAAALAQLLGARNAVTNEYGARQYVVWDTFTPRIVPTGTGMGQFKHFAVSPHVTASATHYPSHPYGSLTFDDGTGNTATVRETQYVNLRSWATSHGWTDAEAVHVQDIALYVCNDSAAIPDGCIPWFIGEVALNEQFGGSLAGLAGWAAVQSHVQPVPLVLGGAYGSSWNIGNPAAAWRSIADVITAMGPRYPVHVGDSGRPIFLLCGERPVVVGHFTYVGSCAANYVKGLPILKAFVESVGDTLKTL